MKNSKKKGFTLIELVVVIAILAILALIMVPNLTAYLGKAKEAKIDANMKNIHTAAEMVRQTEGSLIEERIKTFSNNEDVIVSESVIADETLEVDKYTVTNKGGQTVVKYKTQDGKVFTFPDVSNVNNGETGGTGENEDPKPEVIEGSFKWKKYKLTEAVVVVDVGTENAIGETYFLFNPVFIFENNLNLKPNALYNVLLSGTTRDTEGQLVDKEYTFNHITSQNLLSDNQLLGFSGEQGGYRIIQKTNDPMELLMEQLIVDLKGESGLVGLFDLFKEEKELFLDAYEDYDNIEELKSSLLESIEIKCGFRPEMGDITNSELLLFLMLTDSSIISEYFSDYEDSDSWGDCFTNLVIDLFDLDPEINADVGEFLDLGLGELLMFISITGSIKDLSNYVGIGDTWAIEIGELSMFSPAYGDGSLDRIKIEELQAVGFVGGEEGDYPENGEKDGYWYVFEGENK